MRLIYNTDRLGVRCMTSLV